MPRWLPFTLALLLIAGIVYLADTRIIPGFFNWVNAVPGLDKADHFTLMGGLAWCANHAFACRRMTLGPWRVLTGSIIIAILVTLEEASQHWFPSRTCDWKDLVADFAGIWLAGRLASRPPPLDHSLTR